MLLFLAMIGCGPSPAGEVFDRCIKSLEMQCKCGDYTMNAEDASAACPIAEDEQQAYAQCEGYDLRKCDPDRAQYDTEECAEVEAAVQSIEESEWRAYSECREDAYWRACPGPDVTYDEWADAYQAAGEECADLLTE